MVSKCFVLITLLVLVSSKMKHLGQAVDYCAMSQCGPQVQKCLSNTQCREQVKKCRTETANETGSQQYNDYDNCLDDLPLGADAVQCIKQKCEPK